MFSSISTVNAITVVLLATGLTTTILKSDDRYDRVVEAVNKDDVDALTVLLNPAFLTEEVLRTIDDVTVYRNRIAMGGQTIQGYVIDRLIAAIRADQPYESLLKFVRRLRNNPSYRANQDLYQFLEVGKLSLLPDGRVLAYKVVAPNYLDIHTKTFDNSPGNVLTMPRHEVDDDPDQTCSRGLHVCSPSYIPHFGGDADKKVVVLVAVDPKDFVSFPRDYNSSKARVCEYEVLHAISKENLANISSKVASDWRYDVNYESADTYPYLAEALKDVVASKKFPKFRRAVRVHIDKLEELAKTDVKVRADLKLFKTHNSQPEKVEDLDVEDQGLPTIDEA